MLYLIAMRLKGITYDAGYVNLGVSSHEPFDPDAVRRDLRVIRDDLHCDAVRVTGGDPERLEVVGAIAADLGLEVWFSPFTIDLAADAMLSLLADCAERAERLRSGGAEVVFVTGAELSLLNVGFLPGDTCQDRIDALLHAPRAELGPAIAKVPALVNAFLREALDVVRARFGGKVTYASIPFEGVDWAPFDIVSVDAYRTVEVVEQYRDAIRALVAQGKPVAITEFGSATYKGAADRGGRGGLIVEWDGAVPARLDGAYVRDETEQATYLRELLEVFATEGVDAAFAFTFASFNLPHRDHPHEDLDMAGYGVVKVLDDGTRQPKEAFATLAACYSGA